MLKFRSVVSIIFIVAGLINLSSNSYGQNDMITLPAQGSIYSGTVRGFWFISPIDFTIIGLRVPVSAGTGTQSIQVMKIHSGGVALFPTTGTNFTNLYYTNSGASNVIQQVNIPVSAGDTIGILGQVGTSTSYGPATPSPFPSDINGVPVDLNRFIYQGNITSAPAPNYSREATSSIGRIEVYYQVAPPDNAGVDSLIAPKIIGDYCSGQQLVKVRLSNLGSNPLSSVNIDWSVNDVQQQGQTLTFSSPIDSITSPNHDTAITLGNVDLPYQTPVNIKVWTSLPNGVVDTDPSDDTLDITLTATMQNVDVSITPGDTAICAGSSLVLDAGQQPPGSIFIWSNNMVTQQISVSQPGDYSVVVQSLQGCFAYDTVTITQIPQPIAGDFGVVDEGGNNFTFTPINMQNVTNYHWDFGDSTTLDVATDAPQVHHYARTGTYAVSLTVSSDEKCDAISIEKQVYAQPPLGIGELSELDAVLKVYPNPANDRLNIQSQVSNVTLQGVAIYNMLGKKVFVQNLSGSDAQISLAHLPAGIYQARIQTTKGVVNSRIEILR